VYTGYSVGSSFQPRFSVTVIDDNGQVTRNLVISQTQLTDAALYVCGEQIIGTTAYQARGAQLVVLGKLWLPW
jgi:hypothetical protein